MATALGGLAYTGALCTQISQLFSFLLVHLLEIYTCSSNTPIYSTLGGTTGCPRPCRTGLSYLICSSRMPAPVLAASHTSGRSSYRHRSSLVSRNVKVGI